MSAIALIYQLSEKIVQLYKNHFITKFVMISLKIS